MIKRIFKFPLRTEFLTFRAKSKKISSPSFTAYYLYTPTSSRLSVVVPKKVNKLATVRNWLKRLAYSSVWPLISKKNLDVVIVFKPIPIRSLDEGRPLTKSPATKEKILSELNVLFINPKS